MAQGRSARAARVKWAAGVSAMALATAAQASPTDVNITATAGSGTSVAGGMTANLPDPSKAVVTTTAVNGTTAVNRFDTFTVGSGQDATLVLPTGTNTLVNFVKRGSVVTINGAVTSRLVDAAGQVGGNLVFVTPSGLTLDYGASINTGRLTIRGWTGDFPTGIPTVKSVLDGAAQAGAVVLNGILNAPGGIDISASSVSMYGTARAGAQAAAMLGGSFDPGSLVNTGMSEGTKIVANEGGISIVAETSVNIAGTATAWDGVAGSAAGDVTIQASQTKLVDVNPLVDNDAPLDVLQALFASYVAVSSANASVTVGGTVSGGKVVVDARAVGGTPEGKGISQIAFDAASGSLVNGLLNSALGIGLDGAVSVGSATSGVTVNAGATVRASGDLTVGATSDAVSYTTAHTLTTADKVGGTVAVSVLGSHATTTIGGALSAGGALTVTAVNSSRTGVDTSSAAIGGGASTFSIAYSDITSNASLSVNSGASVTAGGAVTLTARNDQADSDTDKSQWSVKAATFTAGSGRAAGTAAVTRQDVDATLTVAGTVNAGTTATLSANNDINRNLLSAKADVSSGTVGTVLAFLTGADADTLLQNTMTIAAARGSKGSNPLNQTGTTPNRYGASVSVAVIDHTATTSVTGGVTSGGAASVTSRTSDATFRNNATAAISAAKKENGAVSTVAGAASFTYADYTSKTVLGGGVNADSLAVTSEVNRPRGDFYALEAPASDGGSDLLEWMTDVVVPKAGTTLGVEAGFFGSSAGARSDTETDNLAAAGSVAISIVNTESRAWIDQGVQLTLGVGAPGRPSLNVSALTKVDVLQLAGPVPPITKGLMGVKSGGAGVGGAVGVNYIAPVTVAGIDDGVVLTRKDGVGAADASVTATSDLRLITLAPMAGQARGTNIIGMFAVNVIDGATKASVSNNAKLDLGSGAFSLRADAEQAMWAIGGSIAFTGANNDDTSSTAVGLSGAVNYTDLVTTAMVGDVSADRPDPAKVNLAPIANRGITAGGVSAGAQTRGSVNAISVAGTAQDTNPQQPPKPGFTDKIKAKGQKLISAVKDKFSSGGVTDLPEVADDEATSRGETATQGTSATEQASSGASALQSAVGVAGSASLNIVLGATKVDLSGITFTRGGTGGTAAFLARATDALDTLAVSGGAAIAKGKKIGNTKLVAGAYGLSLSERETASALVNTNVSGFNQVAVEGIANGLRVGAGLSLAIDTTKTDSGFAASLSMSQILSEDSTKATVTGGAITGPTGNTGAASVLAYNGLTMGAGAEGLSFGAQPTAGIALTVITANSDDGARASISNANVSNFGDLSVRALNAARALGLAVSGAISTGDQGKTGAAAVSVNQIRQDTTALIDLGASSVNVGGTVTVYAGDPGANATEAAASAGRASSDPANPYNEAQTGFLANYAMTGDDAVEDASGNTLFDPSDLSDGSRILSIAIPVGITKSGTAGALALSLNEVANDRSATVRGGPGAGVTAANLNVGAGDRASIVSVGAGATVTKDGTALIGSVSGNRITGAARAGVLGTDASNRLALTVTNQVNVGAAGEAGIFSLAGGVSVTTKGNAGGLSLSLNEIKRTSTGAIVSDEDAGLHAALRNVSLAGSPNVGVAANSDGQIVSVAFVGAVAKGGGFAGAASANRIAPTLAADAQNVVNAAGMAAGRPSLALRAADDSNIISVAAGVAVGFDSGAGGVGLSLNSIGSRVKASFTQGSALNLADLSIVSRSSSLIQSAAIGAAFSAKGFSGAGSLALNSTDAQTDSVLTLTGASVNATGTVGVVATRDSAIDVGAGALAVGAQGIGASIVVNDVAGGATATVTGTGAASLTALGGGAGINARTGQIANGDPGLPGLDMVTNPTALDLLDPESATFKGVAVNASSTFAVRNIAVTGGLGFKGVGAAGTAIVTNIGGNTAATVSNTDVTVGSFGGTPTPSTLGLDVRANSHTAGVSLAGAVAIAVGGTSVAVSAPVVSDGYTATTTANITGGDIRSTGGVTVRANATQSAAALSIGAGIAQGVAVNIAAVSPRFQSTTTASITTPDTLVALGSNPVNVAGYASQPNGGVTVAANSDARAAAAFGSLTVAASGDVAAGVAGAIVVATNENTTSATYTGKLDNATKLSSVTVDAPEVNVLADARYDAFVTGAAVSAAVGGGGAFAFAGNGIGIVNRGTTSATADLLRVNRPAGSVTVSALETANFTPKLGSLAVAAGGAFGLISGAASLGVVAVLSQSKVDATLSRPLVTARDVSVRAYGASAVDALQVGVAIAGGAGISANVTYVQIGKSFDGNAVTGGSADSTDNRLASEVGGGSSGNAQVAAMASEGPSAADGAAPAGNRVNTSRVTAGAANARGLMSASAGVGGAPNADDAAASRVRAQVLGTAGATSRVAASGTLTLASSANMATKAENGTAAGGLVSAVGTVAVVRNAGLSVARIDSGVAASGGTLALSAATGQDTSKLTTGATKAAEANLVGVSVGGGAIGVAFADAKINTVTLAESKGAISFADATIAASDTTDVETEVVGVAVGAAGALNVAVARSVKTGTVSANLAGSANYVDEADAAAIAAAPASAALTVRADALGSTSATTYAASGGLLFAGNAAVSLASDSRTVRATVAEGALVYASQFTLRARAIPVLSSKSWGISVSGQVAVGASVATGSVTADVGALVGQGSLLDCGPVASWCSAATSPTGFTIAAAIEGRHNGEDHSHVEATGSAGGVLAAVNGVVSEGVNNGTVNATVGAALTNTADSPTVLGTVGLNVTADRSFKQYVKASGITVGGGLAVGVQSAKATSTGTVNATVGRVNGSARAKLLAGPGNTLIAFDAPDLTIAATGQDSNTADVIAGAGALAAAVAALAETDTRGTVTATLAPPSATPLRAGTIKVTATNGASYTGTADATQASAVGGSGSTVDNYLNTSATVNLGAAGRSGRLEANKFEVLAENVIARGSGDSGYARGAGGGVVNGAAALVENDVTQNAVVNVADNTTLRQYDALTEDFTQNAPRLTLDASVRTGRDHAVSLEVGGAMQFPFGRLNSDFTGNANVNIGQNVLIRADQEVGIGTSAAQFVNDTVGVQIYGLAGIGGGSSDLTMTQNQGVSVGNATTIEAMGNVVLSAGSGSSGANGSTLSTSSQTDVWNYTALPISVDRDATANSNSNTSLTLGTATIRSARDVILSSDSGQVTANAVGTGHNPYIDLLNFVGISVSDSGGDASTSKSNALALNGASVTAGFLAQRAISITNGANANRFNATVTSGAAGVNEPAVTVAGDGSVFDVLNGGGPANPNVYGGADADRLGNFRIYMGSISAVQAVQKQIDALIAQIGPANVPANPNDFGDSQNAGRITAQTNLDRLAASNGLIAQLAAAWDTKAALQDAGGSPSRGVVVDGVFAGGGNVTVRAGSITGSGASVTAAASPKITIDNQSGSNLVLGQLFIPMKPSGAVNMTGAAGDGALAAVATVRKAGASDTPEGLIDVTVGQQFGGVRSDLIVAGPISNVGGTLKALVNNGNYTQYGDVQVGSFNADVPSGLFTVSSAFSPFSMGVPIVLYYGRLDWSLNNSQSGQGPTLNANDAALKLASAAVMNVSGVRYMPDVDNPSSVNYLPNNYRVQPGAGGEMNPLSSIPGFSFVPDPMNFTMRVAFYSGISTSGGALNTWLDANGYSNANGAYGKYEVIWNSCNANCQIYSGDSLIGNDDLRGVQRGASGRYGPNLFFSNPVVTRGLSDAVLNARYPGNSRSAGSINAVQVRINAQTVNISGNITAGPNKERSLVVNQLPTGVGVGQTSAPLQTLTGNLATGNIGVRYVNAPGGAYLQVDDVAAGAGGVIDITGRILNTNPLSGGANLKVLNGFANISVVNNTNADLRLGALNAGENVSGTIKLRDVRGDGSIETRIYRNAPGQPVTLDRSCSPACDPFGPAAVGGLQVFATQNLGNQGLAGGPALTFNPRDDAYYVFSETREMTRTVANGGDGSTHVIGSYVSPWAWSGSAGAAPTQGYFLDLSGPDEWRPGSTGFRSLFGYTRPATAQLVTGVATGFFNFGGENNSFFGQVPNAADVTVVTAVKATYPIGMSFEQVSNPGILVRSKGAITMGGAVVLAQGPVDVTAGGAISQGANGSILARSLSLTALNTSTNAAQDIGSAAAPLVAQVNGAGNGGRVDLTGRDVWLNLTSSTTTLGALEPVGIGQLNGRDISITSGAGLSGIQFDNGGANIIARNLTLDVAGSVTGVGANANPLLRPALRIDLNGGGSADRVLRVNAGGDVVLEAVSRQGTADELKIGAISTPADVLLRGWGSIVAADPSSAVDAEKLARFLSSAEKLQLCPTTDCSVNGVQNTGKLASITQAARNAAGAAYEVIETTLSGGAPAATDAAKNRAVLEAKGRIDALADAQANGLLLNADWTVGALPAGIADSDNPLRRLALDTLRARNDALPGTGNEVLTLPTDADVRRGLQAFVDKTRQPLAPLFAPDATPQAVLSLNTLDAVRNAITPDGYVIAAQDAYNKAVATLTDTFGFVPASRQSIATLDFRTGFLDARTAGAVWTQGQLDFSVPSSAFVPVADTQFIVRPPVITARGVTLVAGNSIGNFAPPETFTFDQTGLISGQDKNLARAFIASAGPGDLKLSFGYDPLDNTRITSVSFTTRRDQPLQLAASGVVNAFAATNPQTLGTTATGGGANSVQGDIFLNNTNDFLLGSVVSQKGRTAAGRVDCNITAAGGTAGCDSRVRVQGNAILGVASGAAQLISNGSRLTNADGRALVMGGLVRLEASNGALGVSGGGSLGSLLVDARALEVARAAGDLSIARRQSVMIPGANPAGGAFSFASDGARPNVTSDLVVGDVFAGGLLTLDNPFGSLLVNALPFDLASENRNSRIVAGGLMLRAAGNLGQGDQPSPTGLPLQFDLQTPTISALIAGADYSLVTGSNRYNYDLARVGTGDAPAGLPPGDGWFAVRGVTTIGGPGSVLGARRDMTIGAIADFTNPNRPADNAGPGNGFGIGNPTPSWASSITINSSIQIGGILSLTTSGSLTFGDDVNINSLGTAARTDCADPGDEACALDLSRLALNLSGSFTLTTPRSLLLRSLSANGGWIESTRGAITVDGTVFGANNVDNAFMLKAKRSVTVGALGAGAVTLLGETGDVTVASTTLASDITATGRNVRFGGGIIGRNATLTATSPTGEVAVDGIIYLQRSSAQPDVASRLLIDAPTVALAGVLAADDDIRVAATNLSTARGTVFMNADTMTLSGARLSLDPFTIVNDVGALSLESSGPDALLLPIFNGGSLSATAGGAITAQRIDASGDVTLVSTGMDAGSGTVALSDEVRAGGTVTVRGRGLTTTPQGGIGASGGIDVASSGPIDVRGPLATNGNAAIKGTGDVRLAAITARSGSVRAVGGNISLTDKATVTGGAMNLNADRAVTLAGADVTGSLLVNAGTDLQVAGLVTVRGPRTGDQVSLTARGQAMFAPGAAVQGTAPGASMAVNAQRVQAAGASIRGVALQVAATDTATLGLVAATGGQAVSVRGTNGVSVGDVGTGNGTSGAGGAGSVTLASTRGSVSATGRLTGGVITVSAAQDVSLNGIEAQSADLSATAGTVRLSGNTRLAAPTATPARLTATAGRAIVIDGRASAAGGMLLAAPAISSTARGFLTDEDRPGAAFQLRGNTLDLAWNTGTSTGPALVVDLRGRTGGLAQSANLRFATLRPIRFSFLWSTQTTLSATTALTLANLSMNDWLNINLGGRTVTLAAGPNGPAAERRIATGTLTNASASVTPQTSAPPRVMINGTLR